MTERDFPEIASEMMEELETAPLFLPSQLWRQINKANMAMLWHQGIANFKRTLSQNYYNWLVLQDDDPQYQSVIQTAGLRSHLTPLLLGIERDIGVFVLGDAASPRPAEIRLSEKHRRIYRIFVSLLWHKAQSLDRHGFSRRLKEPKIGNPIGMWRRRPFRRPKMISQDLANSIIEANVIADVLTGCGRKTRIAEVGAGYGRLAYVWAARRPGQYLIFDIPPALAVAQWYLPRVLPEKKVFPFRRFDNFADIEDELAAADIGFFTSNQLEKFPPEYFDIIVTISTLPEMTPEQVGNFLRLFAEKSSRAVYIKQWREWKNPRDGTDMSIDDYVLPSGDWRIALDREDPTNPRFFNRVWEKNRDWCGPA